MPLSDLHVINVCHKKDSPVCRYLSEDEFNKGKFYCLKQTKRKTVIDEMIQKSKLAKKNLDNMPTGDNCKGYPLLRHTIVGYDIKNS